MEFPYYSQGMVGVTFLDGWAGWTVLVVLVGFLGLRHRLAPRRLLLRFLQLALGAIPAATVALVSLLHRGSLVGSGSLASSRGRRSGTIARRGPGSPRAPDRGVSARCGTTPGFVDASNPPGWSARPNSTVSGPDRSTFEASRVANMGKERLGRTWVGKPSPGWSDPSWGSSDS